jgi:hypothetical protein
MTSALAYDVELLREELDHYAKKQTGQATFVCEREYCGKTFSRRSSLKRHILRVHMEVRPFECTMCGGRFSDKANFRDHVNAVHYGLQPFECSYPGCRRAFAQQSSFKRHVMTIHCREGVPAEECMRNLKEAKLSISSTIEEIVPKHSGKGSVDMGGKTGMLAFNYVPSSKPGKPRNSSFFVGSSGATPTGTSPDAFPDIARPAGSPENRIINIFRETSSPAETSHGESSSSDALLLLAQKGSEYSLASSRHGSDDLPAACESLSQLEVDSLPSVSRDCVHIETRSSPTNISQDDHFANQQSLQSLQSQQDLKPFLPSYLRALVPSVDAALEPIVSAALLAPRFNLDAESRFQSDSSARISSLFETSVSGPFVLPPPRRAYQW